MLNASLVITEVRLKLSFWQCSDEDDDVVDDDKEMVKIVVTMMMMMMMMMMMVISTAVTMITRIKESIGTIWLGT